MRWTLREKYGKTGALSLSYDMTFLSLLLSDIEDDTPIEGKERCIVHPITEHKFFTTKVMEYTAAMQILLSHYALIDSNNDEGRNKKDPFLPFIPEIEKTYKRQCNTLKNKLSALWENEKKGIKDPEMNALYFGEALGEIFVKDENSHFAPDLRRMGCGMGRYIYLLDAWDDKEKDKKKEANEEMTLKAVLKNKAREDEEPLSANFTLYKILGGDILTARLIRSQIWLIMLVVFFVIVYISNRYSVQQQLLEIDVLNKELKDAKYKALSSSSELTERCRESRVLEMLRHNKDSILKMPSQPPYIINVPEK